MFKFKYNTVYYSDYLQVIKDPSRREIICYIMSMA